MHVSLVGVGFLLLGFGLRRLVSVQHDARDVAVDGVAIAYVDDHFDTPILVASGGFETKRRVVAVDDAQKAEDGAGAIDSRSVLAQLC